MSFNRLMKLCVVLMMLALSFLLGHRAIAAEPTQMDVKFMNHIQMGLPEQDAFIESSTDPHQVVRIEGEAGKDPANLAKQAYASAQAVEHDPFKVGANPLGPFPKGAALGLTLGAWLAASGSGTYAANGDTATMDLSFQKLVPNGVYTVWCSRITFPPNVKIEDKPCGAPDGSQNVVKADASGNASFKLDMKPLQVSTKETASVVALAYHSDGKTYGATPGDFGQATHVQIAWLMPAPAPEALPTTGADGRSISVWLALLAGAALVGGSGVLRRYIARLSAPTGG